MKWLITYTNLGRLQHPKSGLSPTLELLCKHQAILLASPRSAQTFRVLIFAYLQSLCVSMLLMLMNTVFANHLLPASLLHLNTL